MLTIDDKIKRKLLKKAKEASKNSYSPYSKFAVGAAVLCDNGSIYTGTNIENASYSLTICAERIAIGNVISNGEKHIIAIAVYSPNIEHIVPCGACRQFIREFGDDIKIIFPDDGKIVTKSINQLLPGAFTEKYLS